MGLQAMVRGCSDQTCRSQSIFREIFWPTPTEVINRTAHAAALSALVETENAYRFYFGVYVRSVSRFTPIYMALIDPFRKLIVYPSLLRGIRAKWNRTFGTA